MKNKNFKNISNSFEISNHRFVNSIANGISNLIGQKVPGVKLQYVDKVVSGNSISTILSGQIVVNSQDEYDEISNEIRTVMQGLKNPSNLISIIKE